MPVSKTIQRKKKKLRNLKRLTNNKRVYVHKKLKNVIKKKRGRTSSHSVLSRYDSFFSLRLKKPKIKVDHNIWNIILKRLPESYSMPDPVFHRFLTR